MNIIIQILQNNGYPGNVKTQFNTKIKYKLPTMNLRSCKHMITFNYHSSLIRKVKNLFQNKNPNKAFQTSKLGFACLGLSTRFIHSERSNRQHRHQETTHQDRRYGARPRSLVDRAYHRSSGTSSSIPSVPVAAASIPPRTFGQSTA